MILAFRALVVSVFLISTAAFAVDQNNVETTADFEPLHQVYWQCSAHSSHDPRGHQVYYGQTSYRRSQAAQSAIQNCEYYQRHQCTLHECHPH